VRMIVGHDAGCCDGLAGCFILGFPWDRVILISVNFPSIDQQGP
jgi:hypothetical protein